MTLTKPNKDKYYYVIFNKEDTFAYGSAVILPVK